MADKKELSVPCINVQTPTLKMELSKEDIVAVAVSKAERQLAESTQAAKKDLEEKQKIAGELAKEFRQLAQSLAEKHFAKAMTTFAKFLEQVGVTIPTDEAGDPVPVATCAAGDPYDASEGKGSKGSKKIKRMQMVYFRAALGGNIGFSKVCDLTEEQLAMETKLKEATKAADEAVERLVELRRQQGRLPAFSRAYHARLVENQLKNTEEGRAMLDALLSAVSDDSTPLALPNV